MNNNKLNKVLLIAAISIAAHVAANATSLLPPPPPVGQIHFDIINGSGKSMPYSIAQGNCGPQKGSLHGGDNYFNCSNFYNEINFVVGDASAPNQGYCGAHVEHQDQAHIDHPVDGSQDWACSASGKNVILSSKG
jgi:hypothetical protein